MCGLCFYLFDYEGLRRQQEKRLQKYKKKRENIERDRERKQRERQKLVLGDQCAFVCAVSLSQGRIQRRRVRRRNCVAACVVLLLSVCNILTIYTVCMLLELKVIAKIRRMIAVYSDCLFLYFFLISKTICVLNKTPA